MLTLLICCNKIYKKNAVAVIPDYNVTRFCRESIKIFYNDITNGLSLLEDNTENKKCYLFMERTVVIV